MVLSRNWQPTLNCSSYMKDDLFTRRENRKKQMIKELSVKAHFQRLVCKIDQRITSERL